MPERDCQYPSVAANREVRDHTEPIARPIVDSCVGLDDLHGRKPAEALPKLCREPRIAFEHDDTRSRLGQRPRQHAGASADLDDELSARDLRLGDEIGCEPVTSQEVLAGRSPRGSTPDGHGTPPWSRVRF